jgi:hypothetical protein
MLTGELRSQIAGIWNDFWSGGLPNVLQVIKQITHLILIKRVLRCRRWRREGHHARQVDRAPHFPPRARTSGVRPTPICAGHGLSISSGRTYSASSTRTHVPSSARSMKGPAYARHMRRPARVQKLAGGPPAGPRRTHPPWRLSCKPGEPCSFFVLINLFYLDLAIFFSEVV